MSIRVHVIALLLLIKRVHIDIRSNNNCVPNFLNFQSFDFLPSYFVHCLLRCKGVIFVQLGLDYSSTRSSATEGLNKTVK